MLKPATSLPSKWTDCGACCCPTGYSHMLLTTGPRCFSHSRTSYTHPAHHSPRPTGVGLVQGNSPLQLAIGGKSPCSCICRFVSSLILGAVKPGYERRAAFRLCPRTGTQDRSMKRSNERVSAGIILGARVLGQESVAWTRIGT